MNWQNLIWWLNRRFDMVSVTSNDVSGRRIFHHDIKLSSLRWLRHPDSEVGCFRPDQLRKMTRVQADRLATVVVASAFIVPACHRFYTLELPSKKTDQKVKWELAIRLDSNNDPKWSCDSRWPECKYLGKKNQGKEMLTKPLE